MKVFRYLVGPSKRHSFQSAGSGFIDFSLGHHAFLVSLDFT